MDFREHEELIKHLLACPSLSSKASLNGLIDSLPDEIRQSIKSGINTSIRDDVNAILQTCLKTENGLFTLLERIKAFDEGTSAFTTLQAYVNVLMEKGPITGLSCPYRGLEAFRPEDRHFFFGREEFVAQLEKKVHQNGLVGVIGSSGSGKSSVVFAGLVLLCQDKKWQIITFRPGDTPLANLTLALVNRYYPERELDKRLELANRYTQKLLSQKFSLSQLLATRPDAAPLLLVADQFEELFTLCRDEVQRKAFLTCLLPAFVGEQVHGARLVLTMRADFMSIAASNQELVDALQGNNLILGPMNSTDLEMVIEKPAALQGTKLERGLTKTILTALKNSPADLPLLEFTLTQLWEKRNSLNELTLQAYDEMGGVENSLARYAEGVYEGLKPSEQARLPRIFTQLVQPGQGTEDTRRTATRDELGNQDNWDLVVRLATFKLVVTGPKEGGPKPTVEVAHEALIRRWQRLQEWMKDDRDFRLWQERLRLSLGEWEKNSQDKEVLLRGRVLLEAEDWLNTHHERLAQNPDELNFIELSRKQRDELKRVADKRRRFQFRLVLGTIVLLSAISGLAFFGFLQANEQKASAETERINANNARITAAVERDNANSARITIGAQATAVSQEQQRTLDRLRTSQSLQLAIAARDLKETSLETALLLGAQSVQFRESLQTYTALREIVASQPQLHNFLQGHSKAVTSVAYSPDGKTLASVSNDNTVILWDSTSGQPLKTLKGHSSSVSVASVAFSPDGKTLASTSGDKTVIVWDLDLTGKACGIVRRNLTWAEWQQYVGPDEPYQKTCPSYGWPEDLPDSERAKSGAPLLPTPTPQASSSPAPTTKP